MKSTAQLIFNELTSRGIAVRHQRVKDGSFFAFTYNGKVRTMTGLSTDLSSATSRTICDNKDITALMAEIYDITMPATLTYTDMLSANIFLEQYKRVVVKPVDGAHGNGITIDVESAGQLKAAIDRALPFTESKGVIIQEQVTGHDYRVLVIDGKAVVTCERVAANVIGDGTHTIEELIRIENETNPLRGINYEKTLNVIDVAAASHFLGSRLHTVPARGSDVTVVGTANMGTGGKAINRSEDAPPDMVKAAEVFAAAIGSFTCGVDFMYDETIKKWYLIEANGSPSFILHHSPSEGEPVPAATIFVDRLLATYDAE